MPGEEPVVVDLTTDQSCRLVCPFNAMSSTEYYSSSSQPCFYTVRVKEVFKGNYSVSQIWGERGRVLLTTHLLMLGE